MKKRVFISAISFIILMAVKETSQGQEGLTTLVKETMPAVVIIKTYDIKGDELGLGSGFFINDEGHIITNLHVLRGASSAEVSLADGNTYAISAILAQNTKCDLVIASVKIPQLDKVDLNQQQRRMEEELKKILTELEVKNEELRQFKTQGLDENARSKQLEIEMLEKQVAANGEARKKLIDESVRMRQATPYLKLKTGLPEAAEQIFIIGAPHGLDKTVSTGIVSALREEELMKSEETGEEAGKIHIIQTDAAISPGSSGGPMFNLQGEVVGIATFQLREGQNLNFAVSSLEALSLEPLTKPTPLSEWTWGSEISQAQPSGPVNKIEKGQEWVVSFSQQLEREVIWDGRRLAPLQKIKRQYRSFLTRQTSRGAVQYPIAQLFSPGCYLYEGHVFSANELSYIQPELKTTITKQASFVSDATVLAETKDGYCVIRFEIDNSWGIIESKKIPFGRGEGIIQKDKIYRRLNFVPSGLSFWVTIEGEPVKEIKEYTVVASPGEYAVESIIMPQPLSEEEYIWSVYCQGLEADMNNDMMVVEKCTHCDRGAITCPLCKGEGILLVYNNSVLEKTELQGMAMTTGVKRIKCPLMCQKGKIACPHCVLIERPQYREDVKDRYLQRWQTPAAPSSGHRPQDETGND